MRRIEFLLVIDLHAIEEHGGPGFFGLLSARVKARRAEINIERLPCQWWQAWPNLRFAFRRQTIVKARIRRAVNSSIGFIDVGFVARLDENAAVARPSERSEFHVKAAIAKLLM